SGGAHPVVPHPYPPRKGYPVRTPWMRRRSAPLAADQPNRGAGMAFGALGDGHLVHHRHHDQDPPAAGLAGSHDHPTEVTVVINADPRAVAAERPRDPHGVGP